MLKGIDVSSWQASTPLDQAPDFVVVRAGYGTFADSRCAQHYRTAQEAGKLMGLYWYGQPNPAGTDAEDEANAFVNTVQDYLGETTLWLDFEPTDNAIWGQEAQARDWASRFIHRVHDLTNVWAGLYLQGSAVARVYPEVADVSPLWVAMWPTSEPMTHDQAMERGIPTGYGLVTVWQFTSKLNGRSLDGDIFNGDVDGWRRLATGDRERNAGSDSSDVVDRPVGLSAPAQLVVDGIVGPKTVTVYQQRHGLVPDGIAGPKTVKSLQQVTGAPVTDGVYDGQTTKLMTSSWPALTSYTTRGSGSPGVRALQRFLDVTQDGLLGPRTATAFQVALNEGRI